MRRIIKDIFIVIGVSTLCSCSSNRIKWVESDYYTTKSVMRKSLDHREELFDYQNLKFTATSEELSFEEAKDTFIKHHRNVKTIKINVPSHKVYIKEIKYSRFSDTRLGNSREDEEITETWISYRSGYGVIAQAKHGKEKYYIPVLSEGQIKQQIEYGSSKEELLDNFFKSYAPNVFSGIDIYSLINEYIASTSFEDFAKKDIEEIETTTEGHMYVADEGDAKVESKFSYNIDGYRKNDKVVECNYTRLIEMHNYLCVNWENAYIENGVYYATELQTVDYSYKDIISYTGNFGANISIPSLSDYDLLSFF